MCRMLQITQCTSGQSKLLYSSLGIWITLELKFLYYTQEMVACLSATTMHNLECWQRQQEYTIMLALTKFTTTKYPLQQHKKGIGPGEHQVKKDLHFRTGIGRKHQYYCIGNNRAINQYYCNSTLKLLLPQRKILSILLR